MRSIDLEARVISAVDRIRAGQLVEHDLVECKREWPEDNKARQLAGSLNRAGGDPVIYIIGIDEKTGLLHDVSGTDILDWWGQMTPKFDQLPPEMIRHLSVAVGEGAEHVIAVAFASDRAPYVVKTGSAKPSLEVPMREGTGTRTARRDELLRLLIPSITVPRAVVLEAVLTMEKYLPATDRSIPLPHNDGTGHQQEIYTFGSVRIYVEHNGKDLVSFPAHGMRGRIVVGDNSFALRVRQSREGTSAEPSRNLTPVTVQYDGVTVNGPGAVSVDVEVADIHPAGATPFERADNVRFEIELEVLHSVRPLRVDVTLNRAEDDRDSYDSESQSLVGQWSFNHPVRRMNGHF
ncbi:hypothetical protein [Arthrobacter sp. StoSoilB22]|uniref:hypothetical protein n=1 Tax=Arthrobacter sp. StoSoilB22 TaxID=2830996 RepID=UPI001CC432B7|nr:hypothetical protein [Arthrobacter sp. StoSoilB22]BCW62817.1 hypothetical protein StoSoilB22_17900 [Arthrobacter sp. StoSoilB22]